MTNNKDTCLIISRDHIKELINEGRFQEAMTDAHLMLDQYEAGKCEGTLENVFALVDNYFLNIPNAIIYIKYMKRLIKLFEVEERYDELVDTMYILSIDYIGARNLDQAVIIIDKAMKIAEDKACHIGKVNLLNSLGNIALIYENYQEAYQYFEDAYIYSKSIHYDQGNRFAHNVAYTLRMLGKPKQALPYFVDAYKYIETTDRVAFLGNICNEYGYALLLTGEISMAEEYLKKGHKICVETSSMFFLKENLIYQAEFYESQEDYKEALNIYKEYHQLEGQLNRTNQNNQLKLLEYETELNSAKSENEIINQKNDSLDAYSQELKDKNAELRGLLEEIKEYKNKLSDADKLLSFERMLSGISHRINTSIGNTVLSIGFLQEKIITLENSIKNNDLDKEVLGSCISTSKDVLSILSRNYHKITKFISGMKNLPINLDDMTKTDHLENIIESCLEDYKNNLKLFDLEISWTLTEYLPMLKSASVIKKILDELLVNSMKYAYMDKIKGKIHISASIDEEGIIINYSDNGAGMTPEAVEYVFDPFFTTDMGDKGGSGLGLYFVQRIIKEIFKGDIKCESIEGKGSSFEIFLPNNGITYTQLPR